MGGPTELVPVTPADQEALAAFLAGFPGLEGRPEFWKNRFQLWWQGNPAFRGVPAGWTLRSGGAIKGFLGNLPSLFQLGGRQLTVFSITSWMVLPEFREQSLSLLMEHMRAAEKSLLFDTTPTPEVAEILQSMGFTPLPWAGDRESILVLDCKRCLGAAGLPSFASAALAAFQDLRLRPLGRTGLPKSAACAEIGADFDELWEKTSGLFANTNVRTAEALRWHCLGDPDVEKKLFVCRASGVLAGYSVFKARNRRGLKTWDCADFWEDPAVTGVLESLISAAGQDAKGRGLDLLAFPHFSRSLGERLGRAGLFAHASGRRALVYGAPELLAGVKPEESYFVGLQGDYGTAVS
ncbi:MAG: hypothetical protein NTY77_10320 [Elusimicrobia bacterium]|nr:hypothetical protein [Elusimicrobiota bacterium]